MSVRPFLKELRDPHIKPYDRMYNKQTASYNANEYIKSKVTKNKMKTLVKKR
jgi:hypothetical protein